MSERAISILLHGPAKVGKSTTAVTAPTPMLFMDGENASRFLRKPDGTLFKKVTWKPMETAPPANDGTWEICVVKVTDWKIALKTYEYLKTNNHPFRSLVIDSITEMQDKLKKQVLGGGATQLKMQDWGKLLQSMSAFLRDVRDLTMDEESPLEAIILIAMSREVKTPAGTSEIKPHLEGQVAQLIPYLYDMTAYIYQEQVRNPDTQEVFDQRSLLTVGVDGYEAGNRVGYSRNNGRAVIPNPNFSVMLDELFGPVDN